VHDVASGTGGGDTWVTLFADYWWLLLIFGGGMLEWIAETFNVGVSALQRRAKAKRKHQIALRKLELEIAQASAGKIIDAGPAAIPGPCVHRRVKQVRDVTDELVGWLCVGCDTRLPADWAVAAEDLPGGEPDA
jgi:hypothetical protein